MQAAWRSVGTDQAIAKRYGGGRKGMNGNSSCLIVSHFSPAWWYCPPLYADLEG